MKKDFYVICDSIRSLHNVGSIFRTSDGLGVTKIYLCGITGTPPQHGLKKVALGAEEAIEWEYVKSATKVVKKLKKDGFQIVALEKTKKSVNIKTLKWTFPCALIVGNEIGGVSPKLLKKSDQIVHIPMRGVKESFNVAVAFGIAAYLIAEDSE